MEQNVDGYLDSNRNGINDQLKLAVVATLDESRLDGRLVDRQWWIGWLYGWAGLDCLMR